MSSVRAFLAVPLPKELRASIAVLQKALSEQIAEVRWSSPENLHLTLRFFGETEQETLERVRVSMLSVKTCLSPFEVMVKGLGAFPDLTRPRVVWLGMEPSEKLRQLHAVCENSLQAAGLTPEKRYYVPHLTLGRFRRPGDDLTRTVAAFEHALIGRFQVKQLVLYASQLHAGGVEHRPLTQVDLN